MSATVYKFTALTGGTSACVDGVDGNILVNNDMGFATVSGLLYIYILNDSIGGVLSVPTLIPPVVNPGNKRWVLQGLWAGTLNALTTLAESWIGPSSTTGIYFKSGNVGIGTTPTTRNNTHLQIVDGIGFPATQVASSDPNTLDDYEEGTCTATLTCTSGTITLDTNTLKYIKVGAKVTINGAIHASSVSSPSGDLVLGGLPFAIPNSAQNYVAGSLFPEALAAGSLTLPMIRMITNTATALLGRYLNGAYTAMAADIPNGGQMAIGITYFTV